MSLPRSTAAVMVAACALTAPACTSHPLAPPSPRPSRELRDETILNPQPRIDVLFVIDDSSSMKEEQQNLADNFRVFMSELRKVNADLHIAVISTNLGANGSGVAACAGQGQGAVFQSRPRAADGTCTAVPDGHFIIDGAEGRNFAGDIEEVFSCIAQLGVGGCGFEHPLAAARRALGAEPGVPLPAENTGFLRDDARLGIIIISDEDDCSAPPNTDLFTDPLQGMDGPLGPLSSFRCNEFGHLCGGAKPPRTAGVALADCHSNETESSKLIHISELVASINGIKGSPDQVRVAAITGPPSPYALEVGPTSPVDVAPSCTSAQGKAAPAVRTKEFLDAFGSRAALESICADDFAPAMEHIARSFIDAPPACLAGRVYDRNTERAGMQPDCAVTARPSGGAEQVVPACDDSAAKPCWRVVESPTCAGLSPQGLEVTLEWEGGTAPPNTAMKFACDICTVPNDPRCVGG